MELKANELRLGNFIYKCYPDGKEISEVISVSKSFVNGFGISAIEPIPLTEEWLLKFGFEKIIVENYPVYIFEGFMIEIYTDNCIVCYNNSEITKIKFIHSVQNTYFCIKHKELICVNI